MATKNRYYLIACGTSDCPNYQDLDSLEHVNEDVEKITELFTQKFGYERILPSLAINPHKDKIIGYQKKSFADWLESEERQENDIVVFYYSGHGLNHKKDNKHYLVLEESVPNNEWQTAIATEDLVRPLSNSKISQILFIVDTCHSQGGASDLVNLASQLLGKFEKVEGKTIDVHVIAACRTKQNAIDGEFSKAFVQALEKLSEDLQSGFIEHSKIVKIVNDILGNDEQKAKFNNAFCEQTANFFPYIPTTLKNWEQKRQDCVEHLASILHKHANSSLNAINYFLLSCNLTINLIQQEADIENILNELSQKKVNDEVCPLIACSEWCRRKLGNSSKPLATEIKAWQQNIIKYREGVCLNKVTNYVRKSFAEFEKIIKTKEWRILVEIESQLDANGTGLSTENCYFNLQLWVESQTYPLGRFATEILLGLDELEDRKQLVELIRQARFSLDFPVKKLGVEFLIPCELFSNPMDKLPLENEKTLGERYCLFINSFSRYRSHEYYYMEIRDDLWLKKEEFWDEVEELSEDKFYFSGSQVPSKEDLEEIEENHSIAIWTRNEKHSIELGKGLKRSEWKEWPQKIKQLRKQDEHLEITLFWDDMFPKPRPKKLFNTELVE